MKKNQVKLINLLNIAIKMAMLKELLKVFMKLLLKDLKMVNLDQVKVIKIFIIINQ